MSLKLDVGRIAVSMSTLTGETRQAEFFVPVPEGVASPSANLAHQLNDPDVEFLPCRIEDQTFLVRVDSIAFIGIDSGESELAALEEVGAVSHRVDLDLTTGDSLEGALLVEGSEHARRVSDYLNRASERFLLLRASDAVVYVNRRAVTRVREEPE